MGALEKFQVSNIWDNQLKHDLASSVIHKPNRQEHPGLS